MNERSGYWPECDESQATETPGCLCQEECVPGGVGCYQYGHYCNATYATSLNEMFNKVGLCYDDPGNCTIRRQFIAQAAYETAFFSTLHQPYDNGTGVIHMIPANRQINVDDMDELFPDDGVAAAYASLHTEEERMAFFQDPKYAWLSAAAWMKRTNRVIPACGEDLFAADTTNDRMTVCILGSYTDRSDALAWATADVSCEVTIADDGESTTTTTVTESTNNDDDSTSTTTTTVIDDGENETTTTTSATTPSPSSSEEDEDGDYNSASSSDSDEVNWTVVVVIVSSIICGLLAVVVISYVWYKRSLRKRSRERRRTPSTVKGEHYVDVKSVGRRARDRRNENTQVGQFIDFLKSK